MTTGRRRQRGISHNQPSGIFDQAGPWHTAFGIKFLGTLAPIFRVSSRYKTSCRNCICTASGTRSSRCSSSRASTSPRWRSGSGTAPPRSPLRSTPTRPRRATSSPPRYSTSADLKPESAFDSDALMRYLMRYPFDYLRLTTGSNAPPGPRNVRSGPISARYRNACSNA